MLRYWPVAIIVVVLVVVIVQGLLFPRSPEQIKADFQAQEQQRQASAERSQRCAPVYAQWDRVYKLHNRYGDNVATQADVDFAKGVWTTCLGY